MLVKHFTLKAVQSRVFFFETILRGVCTNLLIMVHFIDIVDTNSRIPIGGFGEDQYIFFKDIFLHKRLFMLALGPTAHET